VTEPETGTRLDTVVAARLSDLSRSYAGRLIRAGHIVVNGTKKKAGYPVKAGDVICVDIPPPEPLAVLPESIPLSILFEDKDVIVLAKPPGIVVHPGAGHQRGTLVNALLHHCRDLTGIGSTLRPGIVHRLDKDTSGCLVVAKNNVAHAALSQQFKTRETKKRYLALVYGAMRNPAGVIDDPVGRHPSDRKKMSTQSRQGRPAETRWYVKEHFPGMALLDIDLRTGRTHQIRVHLAALGHPVVGDPVYGGTKRWKSIPAKDIRDHIKTITRQMLHAWKLAFVHPRTGHAMAFESPLPEDMASLLRTLREVTARG
jgi:23S rRNA pseudouridine1911/1915/1917 synthase